MLKRQRTGALQDAKRLSLTDESREASWSAVVLYRFRASLPRMTKGQPTWDLRTSDFGFSILRSRATAEDGRSNCGGWTVQDAACHTPILEIREAFGVRRLQRRFCPPLKNLRDLRMSIRQIQSHEFSRGRRTIHLLRSGASADRRKLFFLFSDGGALPRRRYANHGRRSRVRRARAFTFPAGANVTQAFGHDAAGCGRNINANPTIDLFT